MRKDGQVTVFLSLVLVCIFGLLCGILESARTAGTRYYLQTAINSSIQSVFSQYNRALWQQYRILGLECGTTEALEQEMVKYLEPYFSVKQFYPMEIEEVKAVNQIRLTDEGGRYFQQEILDYMNYGIWDFDLEQEEGSHIFATIKEAFGVREMSDSWREHTGEAMKLERALEDIMNSIEIREEARKDGMKALDRGDGSGFRRQAAALRKELERMPKLVKTYENRADQLSKVLESTRIKMEGKQEDMGESGWNAYLSEISAFEEYTKVDGSRRREVVQLEAEALEAVILVKHMMEEAKDVEDYINSWEPEDEEDTLDEDGLWEPLRYKLRALQLNTLSFQRGVKDKESQGILERIKGMAELELMKLVLPEGAEISKAVLPLEHSPSQVLGQVGGGEDLSYVKRIIVDEYSSRVFTNFLTPPSKEFLYEMEYLIGGGKTDAGNLETVIKQLLAVREGANLLFLLTDTRKRNEAQALASSIVGAVGLMPLVPVITFFILSIWALGESLGDVRQLMEGGKVPLIKSGSSWRLSLEGLLDMGKNRSVSIGEKGKEGLDYKGYLKLLLFVSPPERKHYRMMDVMQMNIKRSQPDFLMNHCLYGVDMDVNACGKHVFLSLGLLKRGRSTPSLTYRIKMNTKKAYGRK